MFHIKASYWLPSLLFHDNRASHSRDTIWPWKFKVKVKSTPVSAVSSWLISLVFHIRASYRLLSHSFHDKRASHSWDTIDLKNLRSKVKVKGTPVSAASSWLISLVFHMRASYRLLSFSFHDNRASHSWARYNLTMKIQGQRSRSKVKGSLVSVASSWLISFLFHIIWTNYS